MGYNTVTVIYNDHVGGNRMPQEMQEAIRNSAYPGLNQNFGYGMVISMAHADDPQVVVVAYNSGFNINMQNNPEFNPVAAYKMVEYLEHHGYKVKPPY